MFSADLSKLQIESSSAERFSPVSCRFDDSVTFDIEVGAAVIDVTVLLIVLPADYYRFINISIHIIASACVRACVCVCLFITLNRAPSNHTQMIATIINHPSSKIY